MNIISRFEKMPEGSFALPAGLSCPGAALSLARPGSICASCYGKKGRFLFRNVTASLAERFAWTKAALEDGTFVPIMIREIRGMTYFRVSGNGDLFSVEYIDAWTEIARALPETRFRVPTRVWAIPELLEPLARLASLPNVTVRPSALAIDDDPPSVPGLAAGAAVHTPGRCHQDAFPCPGACIPNNCRVCWDRPEIPVSYPLH